MTFEKRLIAKKQLKGLLHIKKIALIVSVNAAWRDLSEAWYRDLQKRSQTA